MASYALQTPQSRLGQHSNCNISNLTNQLGQMSIKLMNCWGESDPGSDVYQEQSHLLLAQIIWVKVQLEDQVWKYFEKVKVRLWFL